jgi:hypothetical protein
VEDDERMINGWSSIASIMAIGTEIEVPEPIIERDFLAEADEDEVGMSSGNKKGKEKHKGKKVLQMSPKDLVVEDGLPLLI